jgi:hypothetical protein
MTARESLRQRLAIVRRDGLRCGLDGCPVGGWGETEQALRQLAEELPLRQLRAYTVHDLVQALYYVDQADRYRWRDNAEVSR